MKDTDVTLNHAHMHKAVHNFHPPVWGVCEEFFRGVACYWTYSEQLLLSKSRAIGLGVLIISKQFANYH